MGRTTYRPTNQLTLHFASPAHHQIAETRWAAIRLGAAQPFGQSPVSGVRERPVAGLRGWSWRVKGSFEVMVFEVEVG
jgi:hypothetical protein